MKSKRRRAAEKGGGGALPVDGRKNRKVVFTLPPEEVMAECKKQELDPICGGLVLAVQKLMVAANWTMSALSKKSRVSLSHLSKFLRLKSLLSYYLVKRLARAFGVTLGMLDDMAEALVEN
jgi:hypothetical protein